MHHPQSGVRKYGNWYSQLVNRLSCWLQLLLLLRPKQSFITFSDPFKVKVYPFIVHSAMLCDGKVIAHTCHVDHRIGCRCLGGKENDSPGVRYMARNRSLRSLCVAPEWKISVCRRPLMYSWWRKLSFYHAFGTCHILLRSDCLSFNEERLAGLFISPC